MQVQRLAWLGTRTEEFDETTAFFRDVLGIPMVYEEPGFAMLAASRRRARLRRGICARTTRSPRLVLDAVRSSACSSTTSSRPATSWTPPASS